MLINQVQLFLIFLFDGIIIGLFFDFFRILRKSFVTSDFITYLEDVIFLLIAGISILYFMFVFNNGEIRSYMFIGIALGITLYMYIFSSYVIKANVTIIKFIKKIVVKILTIILVPICYVYKMILRIFLRPISFVFLNFRKIFTNFVKNNPIKFRKVKKTKNNPIKFRKVKKKQKIIK